MVEEVSEVVEAVVLEAEEMVSEEAEEMVRISCQCNSVLLIKSEI